VASNPHVIGDETHHPRFKQIKENPSSAIATVPSTVGDSEVRRDRIHTSSKNFSRIFAHKTISACFSYFWNYGKMEWSTNPKEGCYGAVTLITIKNYG
jgi:hypothetical protein